MKTIVVVSPTLENYMDRVRSMAQTYVGDEDKWFTLSEESISDADDRDEFSFIKMAVWSQLMEREFFPPCAPFRINNRNTSTEPGISPGSVFWVGVNWTPITMQIW